MKKRHLLKPVFISFTMNNKMHSWICMSVATLLVFVDLRTGAFQQTAVPRRCYHCSSGVNTTSTCDHPAILLCPQERPYCATIVTLPNFTSTLTCVEALGRCSLSSRPQAHELTCSCSTQLCNAPFSRDLQNELHNYTSQIKNSNATDSAFVQIYRARFVNLTEDEVYKRITVQEPSKHFNLNLSVTTSTLKPIHFDVEHPRAEALKHDGMTPSDDDEDDGEGSGSYEDARTRRPASAPAAPSSYLPAGESKASQLFTNVSCLILIIFHFIV